MMSVGEWLILEWKRLLGDFKRENLNLNFEDSYESDGRKKETIFE